MRVIWTVLAVSLPTTAYAASDLSTPQGRFVDLIRVLTYSGRLDDPDKVGPLLGTRLKFALSDEVRYAEDSCAGARAGERRLKSYVTDAYTPEATPTGLNGVPIDYKVRRDTFCDGAQQTSVEVQLTGLFYPFCIRVEDVKAAVIPGLWGGNPLPGNPFWTFAFEGWADNDVGSEALLSWPHASGNVNVHGECLANVMIRQNAAFSASARRRARELAQHPPPLMGAGSGAAMSDGARPPLSSDH